MTSVASIVTLSPRDFDAVLFDLDGVLTRTESVHAAAWKRLFDAFLERRSSTRGEVFAPFDIDLDYRRYVDGKPRQDGALSFLESRGIELPIGGPEDAPGEQSVQALGKLKDRYFMQQLEQHGVEVYEGSVELVRSLRAANVRTAVVSSSKNTEAVLAAVGISELFDARVDGNDVVRLGIAGKPAPDAFLEGARRVGADPARTVVVEDATAGVAAGRAGGFGLVIGVDRSGQSQALRQAGADVVVTGLQEVEVAAGAAPEWSLVYEGLDEAREGIREALCALGNGYFETRGAAAWARADGVHYPGTYLAGGYNRGRSNVAGREVEHEDLVNLPDWLSLGFRIAEGEWFDERTVEILSYRQELDLERGTLERSIHFQDREGRRSRLRERRLVSMADMHLATLELSLIAENWAGNVTLRFGIDGRVVNSGAKLYERFDNRHLEPLSGGAVGADGVALLVQTRQSQLRVAQAARGRLFVDGRQLEPERRLIEEPGFIGQELDLMVEQGQSVTLEKIAALYTSRDAAISECVLAARKAIERAGRFEAVLAEHVLSWKHLWRVFDMRLAPAGPGFTLNVPALLRLHLFHLLQAVSLNSIGLDVGVPARGWTGEAYQGHIFWDELFIFPTLNLRMPEITRSLLMYRYRRLGEARAAAEAAGFRGAMFPWQSGSDGQEQTQAFNLNPRSQRWVPDNSYRQRHVGSAIAYNVWQYFQVTHDVEFLQFYGAELILEIARFWSSIATFDAERGRYEIRGVMGPDEFHEAYPDAAAPGLNNNAYTNLMAVWVFCRALEVLELLPDIRRSELVTRLALSADEVARWSDISRRMFVPLRADGIIEQFEGYEALAELDWESYRLRYGNIQRLELILEAENDSANRYKLSKQADVLMLFYLFSANELETLFARLEYPFDRAAIPRNVDYYDRRSSHGSTLSRVVHAWVLARSDRARALGYYTEALQSDVADIQQGTTAEGIHLGAMAGTVDLVLRVSTGIEVTGDVLRFNPRLPEELTRLELRIRYRGHTLDLKLTRESFTLSGRERGLQPIRIAVENESFEFTSGSTRVFALDGKRD